MSERQEAVTPPKPHTSHTVAAVELTNDGFSVFEIHLIHKTKIASFQIRNNT